MTENAAMANTMLASKFLVELSNDIRNRYLESGSPVDAIDWIESSDAVMKLTDLLEKAFTDGALAAQSIMLPLPSGAVQE